jgi:prepilin-type N-terminal cleavage/methylation domain-containing protein
VRRTGFTLIEVIVSVGIIVMMLAISLPAFLEFQKRQNLSLAAESIRDAMLEAYNYSLAPRAADGTSLGKQAGTDLYRISFSLATPQQYFVEEQTFNGSGTPPNAPSTAQWAMKLRSALLPAGVVYCSFTPSTLSAADAGIAYSISKGGRIVDAAGKELYSSSLTGPLEVVLRHKALPNEVQKIQVLPETGQISITPAQGTTCPL